MSVWAAVTKYLRLLINNLTVLEVGQVKEEDTGRFIV
jgi:hypothetical protein